MPDLITQRYKVQGYTSFLERHKCIFHITSECFCKWYQSRRPSSWGRLLIWICPRIGEKEIKVDLISIILEAFGDF